MGLIRRGKMEKIILSMLLIFILSPILQVYSDWTGPVEVVTGSWGNGTGQFALKSGDTGDGFPRQFCISSGGYIAIADEFNSRVQTFRLDGTFIASFGPQNIPEAEGWKLGWPLVIGCLSNGVYTEFDRFTQIYGMNGSLISSWDNLLGGLVTILSNDNFIAEASKKYYTYSPTGALIRTTTERPLELGKVKEKKTGQKREVKRGEVEGVEYTYTVQYPDLVNTNNVKTYIFTADREFMRFFRDSNDSIYGINPGGVWKYNNQGELVASLILPKDEYGAPQVIGAGVRRPLIAQYGEPVIAPNGDVYTWKRTPTTYSIIKWTWK